MQFDDLLDEMARRPAFEHGLPASQTEITLVEQALGIQLPEDYRKFLKRFGFALWEGDAIYGIYELGSLLPPSFDLDTVRQTLKHRSRQQPPGFADVAALGNVVRKYEGGGFYFLFAESTSRAGQVVLFQFGEGESDHWTSFAEFLSYVLGR